MFLRFVANAVIRMFVWPDSVTKFLRTAAQTRLPVSVNGLSGPSSAGTEQTAFVGFGADCGLGPATGLGWSG